MIDCLLAIWTSLRTNLLTDVCLAACRIDLYIVGLEKSLSKLWLTASVLSLLTLQTHTAVVGTVWLLVVAVVFTVVRLDCT